MRTISQIEKKYSILKASYRLEVKQRGYSENMGDIYIASFLQYIGDIWDYSYDARKQIIEYQSCLFDYVAEPIY